MLPDQSPWQRGSFTSDQARMVGSSLQGAQETGVRELLRSWVVGRGAGSRDHWYNDYC